VSRIGTGTPWQPAQLATSLGHVIGPARHALLTRQGFQQWAALSQQPRCSHDTAGMRPGRCARALCAAQVVQLRIAPLRGGDRRAVERGEPRQARDDLPRAATPSQAGGACADCESYEGLVVVGGRAMVAGERSRRTAPDQRTEQCNQTKPGAGSDMTSSVSVCQSLITAAAPGVT